MSDVNVLVKNLATLILGSSWTTPVGLHLAGRQSDRAFLLHQPGETAFPGLLFPALVVICWKRRLHGINR